jgi:hypothetical protein
MEKQPNFVKKRRNFLRLTGSNYEDEAVIRK